VLALGASPNEHEAAAAVAKAQDMLLAYGLQMEQVTGRKANSNDIKETSPFDVFEFGKPTAWRMDVLRAVAKTGGCYVVTRGRAEQVQSKHARYGTRYASIQTAYFVGFPGDVEVAAYAHSFLVAEIERLAKAYADTMWAEISQMATEREITFHAAEERYVWLYGTHPLKAKTSWTKGAAAGVVAMLESEAYRREHSDEMTMALVVNRTAALRDYRYMKNFGMTYDEFMKKHTRPVNPAAVTKPLTPAQERAQRERDERAWARYSRKTQNEQDRKWAAMDRQAYRHGEEAGRKMSVRPAVDGDGAARPAIEKAS